MRCSLKGARLVAVEDLAPFAETVVASRAPHGSFHRWMDRLRPLGDALRVNFCLKFRNRWDWQLVREVQGCQVSARGCGGSRGTEEEGSVGRQL